MSILDEAIKDHLELKRKRGAGTEEIDRLEREAFGDAPAPPPVQPAPVEGQDEVRADERDEEQETLPHEPVPEPFTEEEPYESAPLAGETPEPAPPEAESGWEEPEEHPVEDEEDVPLGNFAVGGKARFETDEEEVVPVAPSSSEQPEAAPRPPDDRAEDEHEGEELLEETPEFLRDSPGDDKLWFEQRPPKDFDFGDD